MLVANIKYKEKPLKHQRRLRLLSNKRIFKLFPYMDLCKTSEPRHGAIFDPRAII